MHFKSQYQNGKLITTIDDDWERSLTYQSPSRFSSSNTTSSSSSSSSSTSTSSSTASSQSQAPPDFCCTCYRPPLRGRRLNYSGRSPSSSTSSSSAKQSNNDTKGEVAGGTERKSDARLESTLESVSLPPSLKSNQGSTHSAPATALSAPPAAGRVNHNNEKRSRCASNDTSGDDSSVGQRLGEGKPHHPHQHHQHHQLAHAASAPSSLAQPSHGTFS